MTDHRNEDSPQPLADMTACVIVDGDTITRWQAHALDMAIQKGLRVTGVLICRNSTPLRRIGRHFGYYLLRLTAMRTEAQTALRWDTVIRHQVPVTTFDPEPDGAWQRVPGATCAAIAAQAPDVIIKFGMYLLRDPDSLGAPLGVLSFHHGDPAQYRGRPAGFYEVLHEASHVGAMVQRLSNTLDAGEILALSAHRVVAHSYRQTLTNLYGNATHLLPKALLAARTGSVIDHRVDGRNYRLPSNPVVGRFLLALAGRKTARLIYGITRSKRWRVGRTESFDPAADHKSVTLAKPHDFPVPAGIHFIADPLPGPNDSIWVEAMDAATGLGRLMVFEPGQSPRFVSPPHTDEIHLAYPFVVQSEGISYVVPEMSGASAIRIFELRDSSPGEPQPLIGLEDERLVDPTFHFHQERWWLFAGRPGSSSDLLWLWSATHLHGPYEPHEANPIVMDPKRALPAGPIIVAGGRIFRPGQNNTRGYGDGLWVCEITELSRDRYVEVPRFEVTLSSRRGPHTLVLTEEDSVVDSYTEAFDPLAWLHRLRNRASSG